MDGTLFKKGKKSGSWKSRYYMLKGSFLTYYKNPEQRMPTGKVFLFQNFLK